MSEVSYETVYITIEGVNPKPKFPKFSTGSVLTKDDVWFSVDKPVKIAQFDKEGTYQVKVKTNEKGYKSISEVVGGDTEAPAEETAKSTAKASPTKKTDWDAKDRSMLIGGLMHDAAALVAPNAVGNNTKGILKEVKDMAEGLIELRKELK